ncbi:MULTISPECIES: esterase-like activity of phytase family protein [Asticcacaulis]|uniref:esterase-like activity of phytase family protein n=1 Tax=Asticcacaulis TaxID=76890 RepID=UPI001AE86550|nr:MULTISPECIES: esterase-like activity of phytase family protein [Asticcacaulis]MBP2161569.1 hypothetical protein [Asticcacaulis solisilvae]MDR6802580.1 hypothetical protein [Asticcacaulis sp. BE141]
MLATSTTQAALHPYGQKRTLNIQPLPAASDAHPVNPAVRYAGGYELSPQPRMWQFRGMSDLRVTPGNGAPRVEVISDIGVAISFDLKQDAPIDLEQLRGDDGKTFTNRLFSDAEDSAFDPRTGTRYVAFERTHRIMAFRNGWTQKGETLQLSGLPVFPANEGIEGLTLVGDSLLAGGEGGGFWLCPLTTLACRQVKGPQVPGFMYKLTSLTTLEPGGNEVLALYRFYNPLIGLRSQLRLLRLNGDRLTVVSDLLKIAPPMPADNYEGVAAVKTATGYRFYLICDNLDPVAKPKLLVYDWTR